MQVILQGSLSHFRPVELLMLFSANRHGGTLDAVSPRGRARLFFYDGAVVHADATTSPKPEEVVAELVQWDSGTFTVFEGTVLPEGVEPAPIDLEAAIADGMRRAEEHGRLQQLYPTEDILLAVVDKPRTEDLSLTPEEFRILMKIGKGCTLADLRAELQSPAAKLYPIVYKLETNGLLARSGEESKLVIAEPTATVAGGEESQTPAASNESAALPVIGSLTSSTGEMFPLVDDNYTIGRVPENEIAIDDKSVSAHHARISRTTAGFLVEDVRSRNGTFVNGERVTAPRLLADSDVIRVGKVVLTFSIATPTRSAGITD